MNKCVLSHHFKRPLLYDNTSAFGYNRLTGLPFSLFRSSSVTSWLSLDHGLLQHQELSAAGAEKADEQDGHQERGQPLHRRHQQRSAGRAVPGHQGVHPQPQRVPEDHQEPDQDGGEAGSAVQKQSVQQWGADPGGELQVGWERHKTSKGELHLPFFFFPRNKWKKTTFVFCPPLVFFRTKFLLIRLTAESVASFMQITAINIHLLDS